MKDQNSQQRNQGEENKLLQEKESIGGFMAITHSVAKQNYGPQSGLDRNARLFLMLQHHLIGNSQVRIAIGRSIIQRETGLTIDEIKRATKQLVKTKMLLVETRKINGVYQETIYQLHPDKFGHNPIWNEMKKPTFQVIPGGKFIEPTPTPGGQSAPTPPVPIGTYPRGTISPHKNPQNPCPVSLPPTHKNFKESIKNNTEEVVDENGIPWERVKAKLLENYPDDQSRLECAYGQIKTEMKFKGMEVLRPAGFILKSWSFLRNDFAFVDDVERSKVKGVSDLGPRETCNPDLVKTVMDSFFKSMAK